MSVNDSGNYNRCEIVSTKSLEKEKKQKKTNENRGLELFDILGIAMPQMIFRTIIDPAAERAGEGTSGPTKTYTMMAVRR